MIMVSELEQDASNVKSDYLSEDLLILILVSLPPKSIFRFRSVSKTWNNIISTPFFLQSFNGKANDSQCLLALIANTSLKPRKLYKILSLDRINHDLKTHGTTDMLSLDLGHYLINSSNGLTLWLTDEKEYTSSFKIQNLLTGKVVSLPGLPKKEFQEHCMALVCEKSTEELAASYKVVVVDARTVDTTLIMNTYSSKTSKWSSSTPLVKVKKDVRLMHRPLLVVNGIVHWPTWNNCYLIAYDSNRSHVQLIKLPCNVDNIRIARSDSDDDLWLCAHQEKYVLKCWMLPVKGGRDSRLSTEWILKYRFDLDDLVKENGEMFRVSVNDFIWLEALISGKEQIAVLIAYNRLLTYNMESKSVNEVTKLDHRIPGVICDYMETFCLSSYAL